MAIMSELTARLAIYGSIDRAVVEERVSVSEVARYLPPYSASALGSVESAAGWYTALAEVVAIAAEAPDAPNGSTLVPPDAVDPDAAINQMAEFPPLSEIEAEHRFRALFLTCRLLPDVDTSSSSAFAAALRRVVSFGGGQDEVIDPEAAPRLFELMRDTSRYPDGASYTALAAEGHAMGFLSATTAALAAATCDESTSPFKVPGTGDTDVASVVTSRVAVSAADCSVGDLRLRFHPGRWPACLPSFWGAMDPLAPPPPKAPSPNVDPGTALFVYREHVGDQINKSQWFSPVLEFWYSDLSTGPATNRTVNGFAIHYRLARTLPPGAAQDPNILVDDGEMTVRRSATAASGSMTVTATTYKKLAMAPPLPSAGLAIFACASGWADQAKALATGCLLNP